ncbi:cupin domain-containing protein [Sporosarcina koreensis]|uniref:Cupin domain-containing protein n=1 Tax=Sporosarcina koreensis TaxID=334735 RepID=A0ABW0U2X8_9BACL
MYYVPNTYQHQNPYYIHAPMLYYEAPPGYWAMPAMPGNANLPVDKGMMLKDYGPNPFVVNINQASKQNNTFRTALWTGKHLQVTLMSIKVGEDIGVEIHPTVDQFLRIEQGQGIVQMGNTKDNLSFQRNIHDDSAIMVPAGTWHNVINTGNIPLKLYSIYAPPNHPFGTVHVTKEDAMAEE